MNFDYLDSSYSLSYYRPFPLIPLPGHSRDIYQEILEQQRQWLIQKNHEKNTLSEEVVRRHLLYLDLEEEKLKFL